jgi:metal-responsive CopG/Arc/MetJ family transcriptional regulator
MKKQVSLTIDSDILNAIDETAKAIRRTRSDTVSELLRMLMWVDMTEKFMEQSAGTGAIVKTFAKNLRGA